MKKEEWISITVKPAPDSWWWDSQPPEHWYIDNLSVGQKSFNTFGKNIAEITNLQTIDSGGARRISYIEMKILASYDKKRKIYQYNFQPLQIGKPIDLTFGANNVHGLVTYIGSDGIKYINKEIDVKIFAAFPWEAESYKQGMQMKDSLGRVLVEIKSVNVKNSQNYEFYDTAGRRFVVSGTDENRKDITLRLKINAHQSKNSVVFIGGEAIKIGEEIWLHFPNVIVKRAIISKIY